MIFFSFSFYRLIVVTKTKLSKLYYRKIYIYCIVLAETFVKGRDLLQYNELTVLTSWMTDMFLNRSVPKGR